jgi:hypothetical protein
MGADHEANSAGRLTRSEKTGENLRSGGGKCENRHQIPGSQQPRRTIAFPVIERQTFCSNLKMPDQAFFSDQPKILKYQKNRTSTVELEIDYNRLMLLADALKWEPDDEWKEVVKDYSEDPDRIFSVQHNLIEIAQGNNDEMRNFLLKEISQSHTYPMSHLAAKLMVHEGFDPIGMIGIAVKRPNGFELLQTSNKLKIEVVSYEEDGAGTTLDLGQGVIFIESRTGKMSVLVQGMSDTVRAMAKGRDLKEIVSHPVMDKYPLVIGNVEDDFINANTAVLNIQRHVSRVSVEELKDMKVGKSS